MCDCGAYLLEVVRPEIGWWCNRPIYFNSYFYLIDLLLAVTMATIVDVHSHFLAYSALSVSAFLHFYVFLDAA